MKLPSSADVSLSSSISYPQRPRAGMSGPKPWIGSCAIACMSGESATSRIASRMKATITGRGCTTGTPRCQSPF